MLSIPSGRFRKVFFLRQLAMDIAARRAARTAQRYQRLIELRDSACNKSAAEFARAMKIADTYAVRMFWPPGTKGRKGLGPPMEAAIIERFHLSPHWFDLPTGSELPIAEQGAKEPNGQEYNSPVGRDEESLLLRAFRAADPAVRLAWLDQARGIVERIHTPSPLNGTDLSTTG